MVTIFLNVGFSNQVQACTLSKTQWWDLNYLSTGSITFSAGSVSPTVKEQDMNSVVGRFADLIINTVRQFFKTGLNQLNLTIG